MSLPRYAEYKDSGVAWLGMVPAHWLWASLKWISKRYSGGTPDKTRLEYWEDGTVPWLNSGAVNDQMITEPSTYITEQAFENSSAKWIPAGALVMALAGQGKTKGMVAQVLFETTCNQSMAAIVPSTEICERYLYWWLVGNYQNIRNMAGGDLRDGLNLELLGSIPCPLPLASEQSVIATFLDRETGKIDALITEQEKLLTLLAEKRQATISHAVTRGLNPNAPMKDSGVPWLGEVPIHWNVVCLRRIARNVETGGTPSSDSPSSDLEDGVLWYTPGDFGSDLVLNGSQKKVAKSLVGSGEVKIFPPGSILIVSIGATLGKVGLSNSPAAANQQINAVILDESMDDRFFAYSLSAKVEVMRFLSNASTIGIMNQSKTKEIQLAVPPEVEQIAIATHLDGATAKIALLEIEAERAIAILKERRSALIAAAVTGKIDVRGSVPLQAGPKSREETV